MDKNTDKTTKVNTAKRIAEMAIAKMEGRKTDYVFLTIQNDPKLLADYMHAVSAKGWKVVNQQIGRVVKQHFNIVNDERETEPMSVLLRSYTKFK